MYREQTPLKAVVLASGGLDSTVTAALAKQGGAELYLLTILYGQRHRIEVTQAQRVAEWLGAVEHKMLDIDLRAFGGSVLTSNQDQEVPNDRSVEERKIGIPSTYVPARNTIFLAVALAYAEVLEASRVYLGANVRDYSGYPDCCPDYLRAFEQVARLGTRRGVQGNGLEILTPLLFMTKAEIIQAGADLGVPFHLTHSCYDPSDDGRACGRCDSCLIRLEGFKACGMVDPVSYQVA